MTEKDVQEAFIALMNSCVEGQTGEWNCSTDEGKQSFEYMWKDLQKLAYHFKVDVNKSIAFYIKNIG